MVRAELVFQLVVLRFAFRQAQPPPVVMDDDRDMIRIVEGRGGAIERSVVEVPFGRRRLPDELVEVMRVLAVPDAAAFRRKVVLVPPSQFARRRQRLLVRVGPRVALVHA